MRSRRGVAALGVLLVVFAFGARSVHPDELARRLRLVRHDAGRDLAVRRLDGSSAAFDRRFFYFLESVRRALPPGAAGVAVRGAPAAQAARDLAAYEFAPLPALPSALLGETPEAWILAVYGPERPEGWRPIAKVSDGALYVREP